MFSLKSFKVTGSGLLEQESLLDGIKTRKFRESETWGKSAKIGNKA
ncbi:hypothetical protein MmTuc01_2441 [Methanosarcina mazei Tuc01]|uniref:Uncharacterized protein n=1 Tax=Methanosarcina mazei Tuc01 TaxID=1236903 RepID=M1PZH5_METMZ|nr:hypothetical protein MmTuc01_2441 [Methanosarcina mazei Tuc01]